MKTVKISSFLKERKIKLKPQAANCSGLQRIEKIDFSGKIYLSPVQTNTDMILVKPGDLVISGINVEKGALAIYTGEEDVLASIHYSAYEFGAEKIDIGYLKWFLKSNIFRKLLLKQTGSGIKKEIKAKHLLPIEIQLPSLNRQNEIVRQIQGVADYILEVNQQIDWQTKYAEMLRQSILQQAVEGKLSEQDPNDEPASVLLEKIKAEKERLIAEKKIKKQKPLPPISEEEKPFDLPQGWEWCRLGEVTDIYRGSSPRPKGSPIYWSKIRTDFHWITISDITNYCADGKLMRTKEFLTEQGATLSTFVDKDELIVAVSGSTTGKSCLTGISGYIYDGLSCVKTIKYINKRYLYIYMQYIYQWLNGSKTGSAFPNINTDMLRLLLFPLPTVKTQMNIVERVDMLTKLCDALNAEFILARNYASQLMEAVLQEAFSIKETEQDTRVIEFHPNHEKAETELLAAARGNIREDTWEHLRKRALEIAGEES